MKKILLLAFTIFSLNSVFAQTQRTIFVEEFTQASCPPCETTTPALNNILNANAEKIVQLRYQTSWPGVDPMNADNPVEVQSRVDYYGVNGVPNLLLDGVDTNTPGTTNQGQIDNAYAQPSPVSMTLTHTLADDLSSISVTVTVTNEGTDAYDVSSNRLRVAVMEEDITWSSPPGSTSLTVFEAVMKTFITTTDGIALPSIAPGETWSNTWENFALPPRIYDFNKLGVVAFVQNDSNRRVAQSAQSHPLELIGYPDLRIANAASVEGGLCDYAFVGSATVTNQSDNDANGYSVDMYVNGQLIQTVISEDVLAAGASADVIFDEIELPSGTSAFGYILNVPQGDISTANNYSNLTTVGKAAGVAESIDRDYENETVDPFAPAAGTIVDVPFSTLNFTVVSQALLGGSTPLGGYGASANSVCVNFYGWNPASANANGYMIIADQYEVPAEGVNLTFDYAYTSWGGSSDRLIVEVSNDCGESFNEIFNQAGSQLATAPELNANNARFLPNASQWRTIESDLSAYAGETILLRFRVVSAWGDMLYIDNIALSVTTDINELEANESLNIYPNPAYNSVNVELTTANASNVQLRVIDMLGRTVKTDNLGTVSGKFNHSLDVSDLSNGSYLIFMNVDGKDVVKRLSVAH
jgi:hypothetical protein